MQPKYLLRLFIALALFVGGSAYVIAPTAQITEEYPGAIASSTSNVRDTEIDMRAGETAQVYADQDSYVIPVLSKTTVIAAMEVYAANTNFAFSGRNFLSLGLFVEEIGGRKNGHGFYWTLFINNELSETGATGAEVNPGDIVEWRYQKGI